MKPSEILRKASDILKEDGWCTYELENHEGAHCLFGAINEAATGYHIWPFSFSYDQLNVSPHGQAVAAVSGSPTKDAVYAAIDWNNEQESRTPVLRRLRSTARKLEAEGR